MPKTLTKLAFFLFAVFLFCFSPPTRAQQKGIPLSAAQILDQTDDLYRGKSSQGKMTMKITTENWERELKLDFWSEGKDKSLMRITSPKKEKGTATLRVEKELWNYLPKTNRVISLPSSMMSSSWMGSHFTNDDLVKETRMADDFTFEITFQGKRDGVDIIEITCVPKEDAAVVWGKVVVEVASENYMARKMFYYDEDLNLARRMIFSDVKDFGGRKMPSRIEMYPEDKQNESTLVIYDEIQFDVDLKDDLFTLRNLQK